MSRNAIVMTIKRLSKAELTYRRLHGVFCVYKPPEMDLAEINQTIKHALVTGLNKLDDKPTENIVKIDEKNDQIVYLDKNYADTKEALGASYARRDFSIGFLHPLDKYDSGVLIGSINDNRTMLTKIEKMRLMRVYEIKARLGVCTDDFTPRGKLLGRSSYAHVNRSKIDRLMSIVQASYQREMYKYFGLNIQSQEAFEMASKGLLRPATTSAPPQIYSIRCIDFDRPFFKIEIHCINESKQFLRNLVHDCGLRLKTNAICVHTRRIRDGFVDASSDDKCLVQNDWTFEQLQANVATLNRVTLEFIEEHDKQILVSSAAINRLQNENHNNS